MDGRAIFGLLVLVIAAVVIAAPARPLPPPSIAKLIYSALLLAGSFFLLREVGNVWERPPTALGAFKLTADGQPDDIRADALRVMVVQRYQHLNGYFDLLDVQLKNEEKSERAALMAEAGGNAEIVPSASATLGLARDQLAEIELKVQGINFGQIFTMLRRSVSTPNEVTGHVVLNDQNIPTTAIVRWPEAPVLKDQPDESNRVMSFEGIKTEADLATQIACSLIWAQVVSGPNSPIRGTRRAQYCDWVDVLLIWRDLSERRAARIDFRPDDVTRLKAGREKIERLVAQNITFRDVYRLRAALIALDPDATPEDRDTEVDTRFIYAELGAGKPLAEARETARKAREATQIALAATSSFDPSTFDRSVGRAILIDQVAGLKTALSEIPVPSELPLSDFKKQIETGASSTGAVLMPGRGEPLVGVGFIVAPGWVLTTTVVAKVMTASGNPTELGAFTLSDDPRAKDATLWPITEVLVVPGTSGALSALRVPDLVKAPVLPVVGSETADEVGAAVAVLGYPVGSLRATNALLVALDGVQGVKRVMLGKILPPSDKEVGHLMHDAPTLVGTSGAPVIDLKTGKVLAVHEGGRVTGAGTKENFATRLPPDLLQWLENPQPPAAP